MRAPSEEFHGRHCRQWDLLLKRLPVDTTISNSIFAYLSHAPLYFGNCGAVRGLWIVFLSTIHLVCGMKVMDLLANKHCKLIPAGKSDLGIRNFTCTLTIPSEIPLCIVLDICNTFVRVGEFQRWCDWCSFSTCCFLHSLSVTT